MSQRLSDSLLYISPFFAHDLNFAFSQNPFEHLFEMSSLVVLVRRVKRRQLASCGLDSVVTAYDTDHELVSYLGGASEERRSGP